jgi:hypothetical protein
MIEKLNRGFDVLRSDRSYMGGQVIFESFDFRFQVDAGLLRVKMGGDHEIEMNGKRFLKSPDLGKPQHGIAAMSKDDPFQKKELFLEEAFEGGFDQMAAIRRKMGLGMGDLDRSTHETKWMATGSMNELLRYIRAEKTNGHAVLWKKRDDFPITQRGNRLDLF